MLKGCAFDLGNTLVNDAAAFEGAVDEMDRWMHDRGLTASRGAFAAVYTAINRQATDPFISHTYGEPVFFERTLARLGLSTPAPDRALEVYRGFVMDRIALEPSIAAALRWLREQGLRTALVTNESVARVDAFVARTGAGALFDQVVVSQAVGSEKPDPRIFRATLERLALGGAEVAMFGDNEVADGACRDVGMPFVLVTAYKRDGWRWERGAAHQPDCVIERVDTASLRRVLSFLAGGPLPDGDRTRRSRNPDGDRL